MSSTRLSDLYDIDFSCKTEKSLARLNQNNMLDKKAVGTPAAAAPGSSLPPGFLRRQPASNLHELDQPAPSPGSCLPKFPRMGNGSSFGNAAATGGPASRDALKGPFAGSGTALLNKSKPWDRPCSHNGEPSQHPLHLQQQEKGSSGSQMSSKRYKTELCRPFEESGTCKYGEKCQFAHGFQELRSLTRHRKYKTELCRTFHSIGFCPYGPRCHFIHNIQVQEPQPVPSVTTSPGDLRTFSGPATLRLGFPQEPWPQLHYSCSFPGFPSGQHQSRGGLESPGLLDSPTSRTPPLPSCSSSAASCFLAPGTSRLSGAPMWCPSAAAPASLLYSPWGSGDLLAPGARRTPCSSAPGANNAFAFGLELNRLITPLAVQRHNFATAATAAYNRSQQQSLVPPAQPLAPLSVPFPASAFASPSQPINFQLHSRLLESPLFNAPPSPQESLWDLDSYLSGFLTSGSLSGPEPPSFNFSRRLPIFSRLSISED